MFPVDFTHFLSCERPFKCRHRLIFKKIIYHYCTVHTFGSGFFLTPCWYVYFANTSFREQSHYDELLKFGNFFIRKWVRVCSASRTCHRLYIRCCRDYGITFVRIVSKNFAQAPIRYRIHFRVLVNFCTVTNISVRHGNYLVDSKARTRRRGNLKVLSHESGSVKSTVNFGASPFESDLSIDRTYRHTHLSG